MSLRCNRSTGGLSGTHSSDISRSHLDSDDGDNDQVCHDGACGNFVCVGLGLPNEWTRWGCLASVSIYARTNLDWGHSSRLTYLAETLSHPCCYLSRRRQTSLWPPDTLTFLIRSVGYVTLRGALVYVESDVIMVQFRWTYIKHGAP